MFTWKCQAFIWSFKWCGRRPPPCVKIINQQCETFPTPAIIWSATLCPLSVLGCLLVSSGYITCNSDAGYCASIPLLCEKYAFVLIHHVATVGKPGHLIITKSERRHNQQQMTFLFLRGTGAAHLLWL